MICQECGQDRPLTYRSSQLGLRSVCAPCIRENHPDTAPGRAILGDPWNWNAPEVAPGNAV